MGKKFGIVVISICLTFMLMIGSLGEKKYLSIETHGLVLELTEAFIVGALAVTYLGATTYQYYQDHPDASIGDLGTAVMSGTAGLGNAVATVVMNNGVLSVPVNAFVKVANAVYDWLGIETYSAGNQKIRYTPDGQKISVAAYGLFQTEVFSISDYRLYYSFLAPELAAYKNSTTYVDKYWGTAGLSSCRVFMERFNVNCFTSGGEYHYSPATIYQLYGSFLASDLAVVGYLDMNNYTVTANDYVLGTISYCEGACDVQYQEGAAFTNGRVQLVNGLAIPAMGLDLPWKGEEVIPLDNIGYYQPPDSPLLDILTAGGTILGETVVGIGGWTIDGIGDLYATGGGVFDTVRSPDVNWTDTDANGIPITTPIDIPDVGGIDIPDIGEVPETNQGLAGALVGGLAGIANGMLAGLKALIDAIIKAINSVITYLGSMLATLMEVLRNILAAIGAIVSGMILALSGLLTNLFTPTLDLSTEIHGTKAGMLAFIPCLTEVRAGVSSMSGLSGSFGSSFLTLFGNTYEINFYDLMLKPFLVVAPQIRDMGSVVIWINFLWLMFQKLMGFASPVDEGKKG